MSYDKEAAEEAAKREWFQNACHDSSIRPEWAGWVLTYTMKLTFDSGSGQLRREN